MLSCRLKLSMCHIKCDAPIKTLTLLVVVCDLVQLLTVEKIRRQGRRALPLLHGLNEDPRTRPIPPLLNDMVASLLIKVRRGGSAGAAARLSRCASQQSATGLPRVHKIILAISTSIYCSNAASTARYHSRFTAQAVMVSGPPHRPRCHEQGHEALLLHPPLHREAELAG
jgi:hypothetical protein